MLTELQQSCSMTARASPSELNKLLQCFASPTTESQGPRMSDFFATFVPASAAKTKMSGREQVGRWRGLQWMGGWQYKDFDGLGSEVGRGDWEGRFIRYPNFGAQSADSAGPSPNIEEEMRS